MFATIINADERKSIDEKQIQQAALLDCLAKHADHLGEIVRSTAEKIVAPEDAEDIVQEAFVAAIRAVKNGSADSIINRKAWFVRAARNKCVDVRRKKKHTRSHISIDTDLIAPASRDQSPLEWAEKIAAIRSAVAGLRGFERRLIVYCDLWGHTRAEAANRFGLTAGGVHGKLFRARAALRRTLEELYLEK